MSGVDLLIEEHKNVSRMLVVIRKACFKLIETKEIDYDDFYNIISFIRNFADGHHHKKEEIFLFNRMVEHLGEAGKNAITHGMLVEHDLGRLYIKNLEEALKNLNDGNEEAKLDVIANAISYATLLENHIHKEDNVIFSFAKRGLSEDVLKTVDEECYKYEKENSHTREVNLGILKTLEDKYK
ncbi:hemerythrin domain-containing protein [Terrisporobacter mayombei]|nr:hemerythrin domain-containing protein [Terrisporobacter mayombei]